MIYNHKYSIYFLYETRAFKNKTAIDNIRVLFESAMFCPICRA